jgi:hypothetical protein
MEIGVNKWKVSITDSGLNDILHAGLFEIQSGVVQDQEKATCSCNVMINAGVSMNKESRGIHQH